MATSLYVNTAHSARMKQHFLCLALINRALSSFLAYTNGVTGGAYWSLGHNARDIPFEYLRIQKDWKVETTKVTKFIRSGKGFNFVT